MVARTNKECVGLHQTTSSGCDEAPVIEIPCWKNHEVDDTKDMTYTYKKGWFVNYFITYGVHENSLNLYHNVNSYVCNEFVRHTAFLLDISNMFGLLD